MFPEDSSSQQFDRAAHCRAIGTLGGRATVARHGRAHMSRIGRRGFRAVTRRYFLDDPSLHINWLRRAGAFAYWHATGLPVRRDRDGRPVWPTERPLHPAETAAPGQMSLFEFRPPLPF